MIVADSTVIIYCFQNNQPIPAGELVVPDDLYEEYLVAETRHKKEVEKVIRASELRGYREPFYLTEYARFLNEYPQVSFAKMSGFGDISILALISGLVTDFGDKPSQLSLDLDDGSAHKITVISNDDELRRKIDNEFDNSQVVSVKLEDYTP